MSKLKKALSGSALSGFENKNVSFVNSPFFWMFYTLLLLLLRAFALLLPIPNHLGSSVVHILHAIVFWFAKALFYVISLLFVCCTGTRALLSSKMPLEEDMIV
jgi:hypothetical protein